MKLWSLLLMALSPAALFAAESPPNAGTALITGSDRGIGEQNGKFYSVSGKEVPW